MFSLIDAMTKYRMMLPRNHDLLFKSEKVKSSNVYILFS